MTILQPGPTNSLIDVAGIQIGHADRRGSGWLSASTDVNPGNGTAVGSEDHRGAGQPPGAAAVGMPHLDAGHVDQAVGRPGLEDGHKS